MIHCRHCYDVDILIFLFFHRIPICNLVAVNVYFCSAPLTLAYPFNFLNVYYFSSCLPFKFFFVVRSKSVPDVGEVKKQEKRDGKKIIVSPTDLKSQASSFSLIRLFIYPTGITTLCFCGMFNQIPFIAIKIFKDHDAAIGLNRRLSYDFYIVRL